ETVGSTVVLKSRIQCYNCKEFRHVARKCQKLKRVEDAAYHREKMLLYKQEEAGIQLNAEQADWRDDTDDELEDQELEAHYMYMAQLQEVSPDAADSGPIFDDEPLQKVSNDDHYNVFAMESEHPEQSESVHDTYPIEQDAHNVIIDLLDMSYSREEVDQNDDDNERELLASLIEKLKCEIDENKNRNKFLETSNKVLIEKLKEDQELEAHYMYMAQLQEVSPDAADSGPIFDDEPLQKVSNDDHYNVFAIEKLARRNDVEYASKVEINCTKAKGDLISYKMESQKSFNKYTQMINDLNQMISEMKKKLYAHQETISILSQQKEAQIKLYKTYEDKELDKVISLEKKTLKSQLETQKTQFLNEIDRLSREYYYADHMNAILGVILTTSVSRPQLKSNPMEDRVMLNNSKGKKREVEDHHRNVKFSLNKTSVAACNDILNAKTLNVNFVCATCGKCLLNDKHDMCVLKFVTKPLRKMLSLL
nr:hypothetical protein [Tanacetum cinerariifolium]